MVRKEKIGNKMKLVMEKSVPSRDDWSLTLDSLKDELEKLIRSKDIDAAYLMQKHALEASIAAFELKVNMFNSSSDLEAASVRLQD